MSDVGSPSDVDFWIKDDSSALGIVVPAPRDGVVPTRGSTTGQGFSVTRAEADTLLHQLQRLLAELDIMIKYTNWLMEKSPPAQDPVSVAYNTRLLGTGDSAFNHGVEHLRHEYRYLNEFVLRLRKALGHLEDSDREAATTVNRATGEERTR
jgi:hypothetical protein